MTAIATNAILLQCIPLPGESCGFQPPRVSFICTPAKVLHGVVDFGGYFAQMLEKFSRLLHVLGSSVVLLRKELRIVDESDHVHQAVVFLNVVKIGRYFWSFSRSPVRICCCASTSILWRGMSFYLNRDRNRTGHTFCFQMQHCLHLQFIKCKSVWVWKNQNADFCHGVFA